MARRRRTSQPAQSIAPVLVVAAVGLAVVSSWLGLPPVAVLWALLLVVAWVEPPVTLTGKKDDWGYPTPANPSEEARLRRSRQWRQLRFSLVPLPGLATGLTPGWPLLASWLAGVWAGALAWLVPVVGNRYLRAPAGHVLDAAAAFVLVVELASARRAVAPADHPGTRIDTLVPAIRRAPGPMLARTLAGALCGLVLGVMLATVTHLYGPSFGWRGLVAQLHLDPHLRHPGIVLALPSVLDGLLAVGGALLAVARPWQKVALEAWSELVDTRAGWAPRWAGLKLDAPTLVEHRVLGAATIDTFEAPAHLGAVAFLPLGPKIAPALGAGTVVAVLERPDEVGGVPAPGTRHPRRFDVVTWPAASLPDPTTEADPAVVQLFAHAAMVWTLEPLGYGRPVPLGLELVTAPESPKRVWASAWAWPGGPDLRTIRQASAPGGGPLVPRFPPTFSCPVLIDHHADRVYLGAIGDPEVVLTEEYEVLAQHFVELAEEDRWATIWESVLKRGSVHPTIQHGVTAERKLTEQLAVRRMAFLTPWGIDPTEFLGLEAKLATALTAAPFVSVTGWTQKGSGDRHPQAFAVHWSDKAVPQSPDLVAPADAAPWVLAGQVNAAFDDTRLARPELVEARPLTAPRSKRHLWQITVQLYEGVTAADVRSRSERLRRAMRAPWLRVEDTPRGVVLYVGAEPGQVELNDPKRDALRLSALDWDQAWQDAGVVGTNGDVPHLTALDHLPRNPKVEVRDFLLPPGIDRTRVKANLGKLKAATANSFIEVRESPDGASSVRLLVAAQMPLPSMVPFDFKAADRTEGIAFATGIEGEPVVFDPIESPHLLLAGVTGAGKSSALQAILYGAATHGAELYVVDPVKGGADFAFLRGHARAFASDAIEAAAVMKAIYAEVSRRKQLNATHGVGSFLELPEAVRPCRIVVVIDEFTSLVGQDPVPKHPFDDPDEEAERQVQLAINLAKQQVGVYAGRFAREARSAGVTLLLGTQKLMARLLDTLPGGSDLKTNLARVLLGKASSGERMSALRAFDDAPVLEGDIPKGRGLWEPLTSTAVVIQAWYAGQEQYLAELEKRVPKLDPSELLDLVPFLPKLDDPFTAASGMPAPGAADADSVVDLGELELSLDDLEPHDAPRASAEERVDDTPPASAELDWGALEVVVPASPELGDDTAAEGRDHERETPVVMPSRLADQAAGPTPAGGQTVADAAVSAHDGACWQIDWAVEPVSEIAKGHKDAADAGGGVARSEADDEWGLVPEVRRRPAGPPDSRATPAPRPGDEF